MRPVEELRAAMAAEHADVRRQAVIELATQTDAAAGQLLLTALGDGDWRVREEAVRVGVQAAERFGLIADLVHAVCQGDNVGLRNAALDVLGQLGEAAVGALVASLANVEETARKFVIEALAHSGVQSVVSTLVAELEQAGPNEVASAIDALGAIGGDEAERALTGQLASGDSYVRMAAIDALNRLGAAVAWQHLEPLLEDRLVFRVALEAMGRCGDARAVTPLLGAVGDRSLRVAGAAAQALCRLAESPQLRPGIEDAMRGAGAAQRERLASLTQRASSDAGRAAVELLCLARDPAGLRPLLELADQRVLGRGQVAALSSWGWDAVRELLEVYQDDRSRHGAAALEVASDLARALGAGDARLIALLREKLRLELQGVEPDLLAAAARCMGDWAQPSDARRLVALAGSDYEDVREASRAALEALAERDSHAVADALVGVNPDGAGGAQLAGLIARVSDSDAPTRLHAALLASDPATRCAAIRGLAAHPGPKSAELLALSLTDESAEVQLAAAEALGRVLAGQSAPEATRALSAALDAKAASVQAAAAHALASAGDAGSVEALSRLLREGAPVVRAAAVEALCELRPDGLQGMLEQALGDGESDVVKTALRGLVELAPQRARPVLVTALDHAAWDVRAAAAGMLGDAGEQDALQARLTRERDAFVIDAIEKALSRGAD